MIRLRPALLLLLAAGLGACTDVTRDMTAPTLAAPSHRLSTSIVSSSNDVHHLASTLAGPDSLAADGSATYTLSMFADSLTSSLDVVAVLDGSGSVTSAGFAKERDALNAMIDQPAWAGSRLGIVVFATGATIKYTFHQDQTVAALHSAINKLAYPEGDTYTLAAVLAAESVFETTGRPGVARAMFFITDGNPNPADAQNPCSTSGVYPQAAQARQALAVDNISTTLFGVGPDINANTLGCLYNYDPQRAILLNDFNGLTGPLETSVASAASLFGVTYTAALPSNFTVDTPQADAGTVSTSGGVLTWNAGTIGTTPAHLTMVLHRSAASCGQLPTLTQQQVSYAANDSSFTQSFADETIGLPSCDATPPVIAPTITGTTGANGWYTSNVSVHWAVTDAESGVTSSTGCDDVTLSQDSNGTTYTCTATNGAGLTATQTATIKRDAATPTVTPNVTGTLGATGWYTSDVSVAWNTTYGISGAGVSTGCTATALTSDTSGQTFTCTTASAAGLTGTASVTVKRDASKPTIAFIGNAGTYNLDQAVAITCQATDAGSGLNVALTTCPNVSGTSLTLGIGAHTVNATATDLLGNSATASTTYSYVVNCDGIVGLFEQWVAEKTGKPEGTKLMAICTAAAKGNPFAKLIEVAAFAVELNSKAASGLTADKRQVLVQFIRSL
ncbi:MAG TPA: VWA domain-containing protein [Gemmatimonadaceae bacterium]|jgi:Mg-chelatase subunit ChlD